MQYRPEIDGLRTLAIVPVILYHLKIPFADGYFLPGGFLGVDIFFVISGFLITQVILGELETTGRFELRNFYVRRARRLLPAILVVAIASSVAAYLLMLPSELNRYAASVLAALGFYSNFYWYFTLGEYGAQPGLLQPMLHTWSLAIEEQFYLAFPLFLMVLPKRRPLLLATVFGVVILASLAAAHVSTMYNQNLSFFSPISRAWELLIGGMLALNMRNAPVWRAPYWLSWTLPKLAVALLVASMLIMDLSQVQHPGLVTLPTVLATAALIWGARPGEMVTRILSFGPFVYIGKLSYSLYLWHFPIFAFGRMSGVEVPNVGDYALWIIVTFVSSAACYHIIERPARFHLSGRAFSGLVAGALSLLFAFIVTVQHTDLISGARSVDLAKIYGVNDFDNERLRNQTWMPLGDLTGEAEAPQNPHSPSQPDLEKLVFGDSQKLNVLIVGNSHSKDLFNALHLNAELFPGIAFARFGMASTLPIEHRAQLETSPNFYAADVVMIAPRYLPETIETLPTFLSELSRRGKQVVLVGATAEFDTPGTIPLFDWYTQRHREQPNPQNLNMLAFSFEKDYPRQQNIELRAIAHARGIPFLSRRELLCDDAIRQCALATPNGRKAMYDADHWTIEGALHFGEEAAHQGWAQVLINTSSVNDEF